VSRSIHLRFGRLPSGLVSYPRVLFTRRPALDAVKDPPEFHAHVEQVARIRRLGAGHGHRALHVGDGKVDHDRVGILARVRARAAVAAQAAGQRQRQDDAREQGDAARPRRAMTGPRAHPTILCDGDSAAQVAAAALFLTSGSSHYARALDV